MASGAEPQREIWSLFRRAGAPALIAAWAFFCATAVGGIALFGRRYNLDLGWAAAFAGAAALILLHGAISSLYAARDFSGLRLSVAGRSLRSWEPGARLARPLFGVLGAALALMLSRGRPRFLRPRRPLATRPGVSALRDDLGRGGGHRGRPRGHGLAHRAQRRRPRPSTTPGTWKRAFGFSPLSGRAARLRPRLHGGVPHQGSAHRFSPLSSLRAVRPGRAHRGLGEPAAGGARGLELVARRVLLVAGASPRQGRRRARRSADGPSSHGLWAVSLLLRRDASLRFARALGLALRRRSS